MQKQYRILEELLPRTLMKFSKLFITYCYMHVSEALGFDAERLLDEATITLLCDTTSCVI